MKLFLKIWLVFNHKKVGSKSVWKVLRFQNQCFSITIENHTQQQAEFQQKLEKLRK